VVPGDWKLANVSPIYKGKGGSDNVANYRPISVTNCFIKILEKIIFKHLHTYLLRYNILSDDQSGFRHRDSIINQLLVIYDVIMKNLDIGKDVRFIFCDISSANSFMLLETTSTISLINNKNKRGPSMES
jgi:hypothetical protein